MHDTMGMMGTIDLHACMCMVAWTSMQHVSEYVGLWLSQPENATCMCIDVAFCILPRAGPLSPCRCNPGSSWTSCTAPRARRWTPQPCRLAIAKKLHCCCLLPSLVLGPGLKPIAFLDKQRVLSSAQRRLCEESEQGPGSTAQSVCHGCGRPIWAPDGF